MESRLNGHRFEQAPGDGESQGSLACHSSWSCKELDTTEQLNNNLSGQVLYSKVDMAILYVCMHEAEVPILWPPDAKS